MINKFYLLCVIFSGSPDLTLKTCLVVKTDRVVMGVYSGWDSSFLKYGGEDFSWWSIFCIILTNIWNHVFWTAALGGSDWSDSRPGSSLPGKEFRHPSDSGMDGPGRRSGPFKDKEIPLPLPAFEPRLIETVFYSLSDWAGLPNICETYFSEIKWSSGTICRKMPKVLALSL